MGNIFNDDFRDFIQALNRQGVQYLLVGGYAVILHGYRRTTGDMDVWVKPDAANYRKLAEAFYQFGLPLLDMTESNFLATDTMNVFGFGRPPVSIEILTSLKGCNFDEAQAISSVYEEEGLLIKVIHINTLRTAKKAAGRFRDLDDLEKLSQI